LTKSAQSIYSNALTGFPGRIVKIRVEEIKDKAIDLSADEEVADYPALAAFQEAGECTFLGPLRVQLTVAREYDHIRASGRVVSAARLACSRCLSLFDTEIDSPFTVIYMPAAAGIIQDEEVELTGEDLVSATYEGDEIDFAREISEQVITEIPFKPLCKDDCKGLCPVCGTDLNETGCDCKEELHSTTFGALKNLEIEQVKEK